jgi:ComF family protein
MNTLTNIFFPSFCALCGCVLTGKESHFGLCTECRETMPLPKEKTCEFCGRPLISQIKYCLNCRTSMETLSYDKLWVLYPYTGIYRNLLQAYKFGKKTTLANFLVQKIRDTVKNEPLLREAVIVPVPPRPGKVKEIGWDQVEYLVKKMGKSVFAGAGGKDNFSVCRCLKRRKSMVQKSLNRAQRLENLKGRIYSKGKAPQTVLLIDDVITTGSTMEICAQVLKESGAKKIFGLCLFYD